MDGNIEDEIKRTSRRLETTLEIILEHFKETDERLEKMEKELQELKKSL